MARLPGVVTAAVYPVPDPRTGDQVMLTLELVPGSGFDSVALAQFLADQNDLGTKWAPRFVRITDHIPLTGTGKVDKRSLRAERWTTDDPVWWRPFQRGDAESAYRLLTTTDRQSLAADFATNGRAALLEF